MSGSEALSGNTASPTWLCPTAADRERLLDMESRLRPVRQVTYLTLAGALLFVGPWVGFWTLAPLLIAALGFKALERPLPTSPRPELWAAAGWTLNQLAIATSIAVSGGPRSPAAAFLAIPACVLPARFPQRVVIAGLGLTIGLLLAATVGVHPHEALAAPHYVVLPLGVIVSVVVLSTALMRSDVQHRSKAVLDPLTGMLNRTALSTRVTELAQQAALTRLPVGVVVGDLDHFKLVNDVHGHATGDAVLQEAAYRMRTVLRAYDLAYRIGGEEFVVLLPGAAITEAADVAEQLRGAIEREPVGGVPVTMSFGVAASGSEGFDFDRVFAAADAALYTAKREGRDRVATAPLAAVPTAA